MLTYALSDIHGEFALLVQALDFIIKDAKSHEGNIRIVFLGDYIDRGPNSRQVLDLLIDAQAKVLPGNEVIVLRGNHDDMMLQTLRYRSKEHEDCWLKNGGIATLNNYAEGRTFGREAMEPHLDFIESMPLYFEDEHRVFVHAGVRGSFQEMGYQQPGDLMWMRPKEMELFWPAGLPVEPKMVVHGHTPGFEGIPGKTIGIDGGACFEGGALIVARFADGWPVRLQRFQNKCNALQNPT